MPETIPLTPETVPPLDHKHIDKAVSHRPDKLEAWLDNVPVLRWFFASACWDTRMAPVKRTYYKQLKSRPTNTLEGWPEGEARRVARVVCEVLKEEICWPNDRFVPWDPVNVALWAHVDGLDDYVALIEIADKLGVEEFTEDEFLGIFGMTLGELVQLLMSRPAALSKTPRRKWGFKGRISA